MSLIWLLPLAARAASTRAAPARRSTARTLAPIRGRGAGDNGGGAGGGHLGPHLAQLADVEQAVVEDPLIYRADTAGLSEEGGQGGLQVGGEAGIGHRLRVDRLQVPLPAHPQVAVPLLDLHSRLSQLPEKGVELPRHPLEYLHLPLRDGGGDGEGAGLDAVGDDAIGDAVQLAYAVDLDSVGAGAGDLGAHLVEHLRQAGDLRLGGRIHQGGVALGQGGGEHQVLGADDAWVVEEYAAAVEPFCPGDVLLSVPTDVGAQHPEADEVDIQRPQTDYVPAGRATGGLAEAGEERPHDQEAAPKVRRELAGSGQGMDPRGVDAERRGRGVFDRGAQGAQDLHHEAHVAYRGDVLQIAVLGGKKGGRHGVDRSVLVAARPHLALQAVPSFDNEAISSHGRSQPSHLLINYHHRDGTSSRSTLRTRR